MLVEFGIWLPVLVGISMFYIIGKSDSNLSQHGLLNMSFIGTWNASTPWNHLCMNMEWSKQNSIGNELTHTQALIQLIQAMPPVCSRLLTNLELNLYKRRWGVGHVEFRSNLNLGARVINSVSPMTMIDMTIYFPSISKTDWPQPFVYKITPQQILLHLFCKWKHTYSNQSHWWGEA